MAGTFVLLAVLLEIGVRLFTDTIPPLTEKDPRVGQRFLKSFAADIFEGEAGRKVWMRFNREGFRGPDRSMEKPAGVRRVALLGDSMVASLACDEEQTAVSQLERLLNQSHPGSKWEVLNFGVPGASSGQEMVLCRERVLLYHPDIVLCGFFVGNDLADNCRRLSNGRRIYFDLDDAGELTQLPWSAKRVAVGQLLDRYCRLSIWQKTVFNRSRHTITEQLDILQPGEWIFSRQEPDDVRYAWQLTAKILTAFRNEVESRGSRFAVIVIPAASQVYREGFAAIKKRAGDHAADFDPDYPDERLAAICREADIPLFSMLADFREAAPTRSTQAQDEWLFFQGAGHFNERGNALAAQAVHRFLTEGDTRVAHGKPLISTIR